MKIVKYAVVIMLIFTVGIIYSEYRQESLNVYKGADDFTTAVNTHRASYDLEPLTDSKDLKLIAEQKCNDMVSRDYYDHKNPDGKYIWDLAPQGYKYGENLAGGFDSSYETMQKWIASPTHNANMVDPAFKYVGHATCLDGEQWLNVQIFRS